MKKLMVGLMLSLVLVLTACGSSPADMKRDVAEIEIILKEHLKQIQEQSSKASGWLFSKPTEADVVKYRELAQEMQVFRGKTKESIEASKIINKMGHSYEKGIDGLVDGGFLSEKFKESIEEMQQDLVRLNTEVQLLNKMANE